LQPTNDSVLKTHDIDHTFALYCVAGMLPDIRRVSIMCCIGKSKHNTSGTLHKFRCSCCIVKQLQIN